MQKHGRSRARRWPNANALPPRRTGSKPCSALHSTPLTTPTRGLGPRAPGRVALKPKPPRRPWRNTVCAVWPRCSPRGGVLSRANALAIDRAAFRQALPAASALSNRPAKSAAEEPLRGRRRNLYLAHARAFYAVTPTRLSGGALERDRG